jgi:CMP-2-keto-3-deoxyoctulosonic acid synthetase
MAGAFQPSGFQGDAFQVAPITGFINTTDGNDTANLQGAVTLSAGFIDTIDSNDIAELIGNVQGDQPTMDMHDGFTPEEIRRAKRLDAKIRTRELALYKALEEAKKVRKQAISDLVDPQPIAKVKRSKVQSKQEVKADIPLAETEELKRSISYLEKQRDNILAAVAYRQEIARLQSELVILEAKRQEELDDEVSLLLLL